MSIYGDEENEVLRLIFEILGGIFWMNGDVI